MLEEGVPDRGVDNGFSEHPLRAAQPRLGVPDQWPERAQPEDPDAAQQLGVAVRREGEPGVVELEAALVVIGLLGRRCCRRRHRLCERGCTLLQRTEILQDTARLSTDASSEQSATAVGADNVEMQ